ncbi:ATP-dependent Lhr-like helicase OS=Streptomyces albaduncus OX=68172 GN=FHS32_006101 PE=4 SV=1 [Streptomyces griseoloalbus]
MLVDGDLALYMERGGKTRLLCLARRPRRRPGATPGSGGPPRRPRSAARAGSLGTVTVERINGVQALTSPIGSLLEGAGFIATPRGLRLRA